MHQKIKNFILDTLFPVTCLSCQKSGIWLCAPCARKIKLLDFQVCPYCEKIETPAGAACPHCKEKFIRKKASLPLDKMVVATKYAQPGISRLIYAFKYSFVDDIGAPLADLICNAILNNPLPLPDIIIPIPLHSRRLRWRGFNQAQVLADNLAKKISPGLAIPVINSLVIRKKFTPPQMKIKNYAARQENMRECFGFSKKYLAGDEILRDKKILLIDDISTTGATLLECAKILKTAGAKYVYAAVIARQEMK